MITLIDILLGINLSIKIYIFMNKYKIVTYNNIMQYKFSIKNVKS